MQLLDLPIELLDLIILYCVTTEPIIVTLASTASSLTRSLFPFVSRRKRYTVANHPYNLLLINRLIFRLAFKHIWTRKSLVISLNSDIWLIAGKEEGESWYEGAKDPEMEIPGKRFQKLVGMLAQVPLSSKQLVFLEQFFIG
ncbi:hypothetical protein KCU91_g18339, partial [Aureobasidium melanogenum]